jgi:Putative peptidoglycan binding domain/N-acetylmuramoyl-L-alanine amidase
MPFTAKVVTTTQWGAKDAVIDEFELTKPMYIVIHNTGDSNPPSDRSKGTLPGAKQLARETQAFHMGPERRWSDSGHNFLNTTGGFILEGRHGTLSAVRKGLCVRSAHAAQDDGKLARGNESPGIENEGTFMTFPMGQKQWDSLVELCASLCSSCDIAPDNIRGHRDFSDTDCPGDLLYSQIPRLCQDVATKLGLTLAGGILQMGSKGSDVQKLQTILNSKGFNVGIADGIFGDITRKAVIDFQTKQGLKPDGIVGLKTKKALGM